MTTEKYITTMADISRLSNDEFTRFLPDFLLWREAIEVVNNQPEFKCSTGMIWIDDGINEITDTVYEVQHGQ